MITYHKCHSVKDPLLFIKPIRKHKVKFGSIVKVKYNDEIRHGKVLTASSDVIVVEVFEGTYGLPNEVDVVFEDEIFKIGVSREMLGLSFNGMGEPLKSKSVIPEELLDINGKPINPISRENPTDVIETGISTIDGLNTLVRGQKLPIFTGQGLPHNRMAAEIVNNAKVKDDENFIVIFCGIGLLHEEALFFEESFSEYGSSRVIRFINLASDPSIERLLVPRIALTTAEFFAFKHDYHVLVIMTDITNYANSLREISNMKDEIPSKKGFPGYMYSDFSTIYERAGKIKGRKGSITQIPIISMPNDDISHPIPDLTGYITEGQIVLNRNYHQQGLFPPVDILSSLSRLMKEGVGEKNTREDHMDLSAQLYNAYSKGLEVRDLESIIGKEGLSNIDNMYLEFAIQFEKQFIGQGINAKRNFTQTLDLGWKLLSLIGRNQLTRIRREYIEKYFK